MRERWRSGRWDPTTQGMQVPPSDDARLESRHAELERLYDAASKLGAEERSSFLARECAGDDEMREEVEGLISLEPRLAEFDGDVVGRHLQGIQGRPDAEELQAQAAGWLPERVGAYVIERQIGRGNMGVVFEAVQDSPRRRVALKLSHPLVTTDALLDRLQREADLLGRLQHPGIAQIYESGVQEVDGQVQPFFAMEYIDGPTLLAYANEGKLDQRARIQLLVSVCEAVQHAHDQGIVHRDLKPDNILVDSNGQPKLLDFGVARLVEAADVAGTLRTQAGELLGTLAYMAPEQARGTADDVSPATDVFALGVIAFQLMSGELPRTMTGMNLTSAVEAASKAEPRRLRASMDGVGRDLDTVVGKSLEMAPRARYRSAAEMGADLGRILERRPILANPPSALDRSLKFVRRNKALVFFAASVGLLLTAGLVAAIRDARAESERRRAAFRDLYASEMLRLTDASSNAVGMLELDEVVPKWIPEKGEADLRGWEWRFLNGLREGGNVSLPLRGSGMSVDWHPSGERVVVGSSSCLEVFDVASQRRVSTWPEEEGLPCLLSGVRYSPDGDRVLFYGWGAVGVWKVGAKDPAWMLEGAIYQGGIWAEGGRSVLVKDEQNRRLVRYDAATGVELEVLTEEMAGLETRNSSADGTLIPYLALGAVPKVFDLSTAARGAAFQPQYAQVPIVLMIDPLGRRMAEAGWGNLIRLLSLDGSAPPLEIRDHNEQVDTVDWHPTDDMIASGAGDGSVRVYETSTGLLQEVFRGHRNRVREVRWNPEGTLLASVSNDEELRIWDLGRVGAYRRRIVGTKGRTLFHVGLRIDRHSGNIRIGHSSGAVDVSMPDALVEGEVRNQFAGSFSPDGRWQSFGRRDGKGFEVVAADVGTGEELWVRRSLGGLHVLRCWHPTEPKLLVGEESRAEMVDLTGEPRTMWTLPTGHNPRGASFSPDAAYVAIAVDKLGIRVVAAESGNVVATMPLEEERSAFAAEFSPSGEHLAAPCADGWVRIYEPMTGTLLHQLAGHSGKVLCARWHPSEPRLATGSADGTVKLWDTASLSPTATFRCGAAVKALDWGNEGRTLAAITDAGTIHLWEAPAADELPRASTEATPERTSTRD